MDDRYTTRGQQQPECFCTMIADRFQADFQPDRARFLDANEHLMEYFQTLDVTLGELQVHVRGDKEYGVNGFADVLAANYNMPYTKGRFKTFVADSYVQFAQWKAGEEVSLETLHPYGASNREVSTHYNDQMEMYVNQQTKKMTLNKEAIFANAEQIYHPK